MKPRMVISLSLLVMLVMACSITSSATGTPPTPRPGETAIQVGPDVPTPAPNPVPVTINEGLNSLNSYDMTVKFDASGPDPRQSSRTTIQRQRSNDSNASLTSINVIATDPDEDEPGNTSTSIYQIGNDQCSGSDSGEWDWTTTTPAEAEMQGLFTSMIGLTPLIENPIFVAAETVNGIAVNHFTFQVSGLGATSGAVVNINQGDYWLAIDGQYIVKYVLIVETSMAADSQIIHEEISIELTQVNQPVNIAFPQSCLDASQVTPNP